MEYELEHRPNEFVVDVALARNQPLPEWYINQPVVSSAENYILESFWKLSTCRAIGFGFSGQIPYTAILAYLANERVSLDLHRMFVDLIYQLDAVYLKHQQKKAEG